MPKKKIPYEQALNLSLYMSTLAELSALMQGMERRLEALRQPLSGFAQISGIPLDRADLKVHIDKGPNKHGLILVEWENKSASASS